MTRRDAAHAELRQAEQAEYEGLSFRAASPEAKEKYFGATGKDGRLRLKAWLKAKCCSTSSANSSLNTRTSTRAGSRGLAAGTVAGLVPAAPLEGEASQGNEFFDPSAAGGAGGQGSIGEFLAGLEDDPAVMALVFVDRHASFDLRNWIAAVI